MMVHNFISVLSKMKLLSPLGMSRLVAAIYKHGINVMILLSIYEKVYSNKIALIDEKESISYRQLWIQCENLSHNLKSKYGLGKKQKVAFLCQNHASFIKAIFSVSRLGSDIYLLNTEMSVSQFDELANEHQFNLLVYDESLSHLVSNFPNEKVLSFHNTLPAINQMIKRKIPDKHKIKRASTSRIVLLTGGTTGKPKVAEHQPSLINYVNPFLTLLTKLKLLERKNTYIATPIYHGYGIAILLSFIALGKTVVICREFNAQKACNLIREHQIEAMTVVPLMIDKMLKHHVDDLNCANGRDRQLS
ncbi:AMP-binding protein [Filibacter tadaridae]|uniref:Long-chain-fatty-acid--CoA ligase n=1 Tax=Filibacter tadaridae TaxID=2483811 RepID=A0A3P5X4W5_9BACL|nr:AMP-binding protein [Filibacter tadaridae]VDC29532.1 Long-chain-fatty-acid--CoA ligase [Filibacter tadaridae]